MQQAAKEALLLHQFLVGIPEAIAKQLLKSIRQSNYVGYSNHPCEAVNDN